MLTRKKRLFICGVEVLDQFFGMQKLQKRLPFARRQNFLLISWIYWRTIGFYSKGFTNRSDHGNRIFLFENCVNPSLKHQYNMPMYPREDANGQQYTFPAQMMNFTAYTSPEGFACMVGKEAESTCSNMNSDITSCYNTRSYEKTVSSTTIVRTITVVRSRW